MSTLDIVIVNYRSAGLVSRCLEAIGREDPGEDFDCRVLVVNNSPEERVDQLVQIEQVDSLLEPGMNLGFAAACNLGAAQGKGQFILFINPDVVIERGVLSALMVHAGQSADPSEAIWGIALYDEGGRDGATHAVFPNWRFFLAEVTGLSRIIPGDRAARLRRGSQIPKDGYVDQVIGAFFLVRRSVFQELGGFDERFFLYFEELDFCLRANRVGYRSRILTDLRGQHSGCASSGTDWASAFSYWLTSRLAFVIKHEGALFAALFCWLGLLIELPLRISAAVAGRSRLRPGEVFVAYARHILESLGRAPRRA